MYSILYLTLYVIIFGNCVGEYSEWDRKVQNICPSIYPRVFENYTPNGTLNWIKFTKEPDIVSKKDCIIKCCMKETCNVAFLHNNNCYHLQCTTTEMCLPVYRQDLSGGNTPSMVLIKPVEESENWSDFLQNDNELSSDTVFNPDETSCVSTSTDCAENEVCIEHNEDSKIGVCQCSLGYMRNVAGVCTIMQDLTNPDLKVTPEVLELSMIKDSTTSVKPPIKQLLVSAVSKELRLPENAVTLSAFTVPAERENEHYNYAWSLLSQPDGHTGTMTDQNRMTVKLSNLSEGLYKFKVTVSSPGAYGEAYANVSVLPPKRLNQAPVAIINPASQVVKLPNTGAVLDGSTSTDDDKIISYHWELKQGPIGYQPNLIDTPTLQLNNLVDGNYTFKLTVEDSDHVFNSTMANITVLKVIDYPPSANAGQDIIIYLPQNTLTLNGNLSTDDKRISSWEWTKSPSDQNKAVDMQNTRTPYLHLSNLEEGMYTFVLKVTDDSEQSSTAEVHVFVKLPTHKPPKAVAGTNITIALPETQSTLNGSRSEGDANIISYHWEQLSGPSTAKLSSANSSVTNVTQLTKGKYLFKLTVTDEIGNKASDVVQIKVTQNTNAVPKANAGGDQVVNLPITALLINGSKSSDDLGITEWQWTRDPSSLAMGNIVEGTDKSPVLMLTDVVPGRYAFTLKVMDEQRLSSEDTVSVIVKPDPQLLHLVELTLNIGFHALTESQKDSLLVKLQMLLQDEATIHLRTLRAEPRTGRVVIVFYVEKKGDKESMPGPEVVEKFRTKLRQDSGILQLSVARVDTAVCQNNCSGHGVCDQQSRECMCEAFWMQNLIEKHFGTGESDCDWSILYVIIALLSIIVCWIGLVWGFICLCQTICSGKRRAPRNKKKPARYSLLQGDPEDDSSTYSPNKMVLSETDSDSDDVLFEHRKGKLNGLKNGKTKNGFVKSSRVKT